MKFNSKGLFLRAFLLTSAGNLLVYALMHISFNIATDINLSPSFAFYFEQVRVYITDAWELVFPVVSAALVLNELLFNGAKKAFLGGFLISVSKVFYSAFHYYLVFIGIGLDTSEAIPTALLAAVASMLLCYLLIIIITGVGYAVVKKSKPTLTTVNDGYTVITAMSAVQFILFLSLEVVDTVEFFTEFGLDYSFDEIMLIGFNYLYILAITVFAVILTKAILSSVEKKRLAE